MSRVLIVEDDAAMTVALRDGLQYDGYTVMVAPDGAAGLSMAMDESPDLVILDVMLPQMSGLDVCQQLRSRGNDVPIIMLTARGQETDKVVGLKLGADDYVTKPFSFVELAARIEAVLRRKPRTADRPDVLAFGDVEVDFERFVATKGGVPLELTPREYKILKYLSEHRGRVITRERLLSSVWSYNSIPITRTVDMHIAKLRKKIEENPDDPKYVVTVHGAGYKFAG
jgi:two-component system alkaline phosphatase synthesis response regulator PhoP